MCGVQGTSRDRYFLKVQCNYRCLVYMGHWSCSRNVNEKREIDTRLEKNRVLLTALDRKIRANRKKSSL